ncbi:hypothetical protein FKW77_000907 [Venturia effusa]|uniref:Ubiquitin-like-conjugating enzyme ATG10 n=1 Tax=Venturia effusa TaxID=50376 RepID=A0A517LAB6_9PEZI|nr:hypothetical protein FKW77_000907 [Venturia effusa]
MTSLPNYPFLDKHEFQLICENFAASFERRDTGTSGWRNVQCKIVDDECYLRISRAGIAATTKQDIDLPGDTTSEIADADEIVEEFDEEALPRQAHGHERQKEFTIEYDIFLSPSYAVPILYFLVRDGDGQWFTDVEKIYLLLVPEVHRHQMRDVGIMGGLSMANHPITDIPAFFIHPCRTADAMREVAGSRAISSKEYMMLWMGIIGGSVGLNAPSSLALQQA